MGIDTDFEAADLASLQRLLDRIDSIIQTAGSAEDFDWKVDGRSLPGVWALPYLLGYRGKLAQLLAEQDRKREQDEIQVAVQLAIDDEGAKEALPSTVAAIAKRYDDAASERKARDSAFFNEMQKVELAKRKWAMRQSIFAREPAAVLIGGVLLLVIGAALLIAMFTGTAVPELVSSAFLLILGFFFGQTSSSKGNSDE